MTSHKDTITVSRASIGLAFGLLGLIGLLTSVVLFAWFLTVNALILAGLVVGLVGLVLWAIIAPSTFVGALTGRQARYSTSAVFATILLSGIIILVYILAARANITIDATAGGNFTLSQTSLDVIDRIPPGRTVHIVGFYTASALPMRERDNEFLQRYQAVSDGKIELEYINPTENPARAEFFAITDDGATVLYMSDETGTILENTITYVVREDKQERYITAALNRMLNNRVYRVYFDASRSDLSIADESGQGLTLVDNNLRLNGVQTDRLSLRQLAQNDEPIPADASVLVLARPLLPYTEAEIALIDDYLQRGGSLFILADIVFTEAFFLAEDSVFNQYLFDNYGLRALDAVVIDPQSYVQTPLDLIGYATFTEPPIGSQLPDTPNYFRVARAIQVSAQKPETVANGRIISQSERSYGERDLQAAGETGTYAFDPQEDIPGPIDIAAWAWDEQGNGSKVVLIGDGDFVTNSVIDSGMVGNEALFVESVRWLSGVDAQITFGFAANPSAVPTIFISGRTLDVLGIITVALIPLTVLLSGIIVWYRRTFA
jgi:ABC-type uncharacterized transport system involved in gliding motility auxiliary subunit